MFGRLGLHQTVNLGLNGKAGSIPAAPIGNRRIQVQKHNRVGFHDMGILVVVFAVLLSLPGRRSKPVPTGTNGNSVSIVESGTIGRVLAWR